MRITSGVPALDRILNGGLPSNRAVLLVGGPGTGKSTLAMQYLQAGLDRDEECLFVSTEQTPEELRDSFAPYDFELDHPCLSVATIHATPGYTIENYEEEVLTLDTLGEANGPFGFDDAAKGEEESEVGERGSDSSDGFGDSSEDSVRSDGFGGGEGPGGFRAPFSSKYIEEFLNQYAPRDRVVFDSVSGLLPMAANQQQFRREVLDLIRLFTDRFAATTLFTAEEESGVAGSVVGAGNTLQYNTHGVIRLSRERIDADYHRFIEVLKMRGVDHETKQFEMEFDSDGVHVVPLERERSDSLRDHEIFSTGIGGLDALFGDGLIKGGTGLLEHDGRADVATIISNVIVEALRNDQALVLLPPSSLPPEHLESIIAERIAPLEDLLADDQLFVLDLVGGWQEYDRNIFTIQDYERFIRGIFGDIKSLMSWKMKRIFATMNERRGDQSAVAVVFTEAMLKEFNPDEVRDMYYWAKKNLFVPTDTVLFVQNPGVMEDTLAEFFVYDAQQMLKTWLHDNGLQYIKLEKSPIGHVGTTKLVEHVNYPPYVRIQRPREQRDAENGDF